MATYRTQPLTSQMDAAKVVDGSCHRSGRRAAPGRIDNEAATDVLPACVFEPEEPICCHAGHIEAGEALTPVAYWKRVVLRVELATSAEIKACSALLFATGIVAFFATFVLLGNKLAIPNSSGWLNTNYLEQVNIIVAGVCMGMLLMTLLFFAGHLYHADRTRVWDRRKRRLSLLALTKVISQLVGVSAYLAINIHVISTPCSWTDEFVSWGLYARTVVLSLLYLVFLIEARNTHAWAPDEPWGPRTWPAKLHALWSKLRKRVSRCLQHGQPNAELHDMETQEDDSSEDADPVKEVPRRLVLDGPWTLHWLSFVAVFLYNVWTLGLQIWISVQYNVPQTVKQDDNRLARFPALNPDDPFDCRLAEYPCSDAKSQTSWTLVDQSVTFTLSLLYCVYMWQGFRNLWRNPYTTHKLSNIATRLQLRHTLPAFLTTQVCVVLAWYVKAYSCASLIMTILGFVPQELLLSALVTVSAFYFMPKQPNRRHPFPQDWLQEFAWSEASLPAVLAHRDERGLAVATAGSHVVGAGDSIKLDRPTGAEASVLEHDLEKPSTATTEQPPFAGLARVTSPLFWQRPTVQAALTAEPMFCLETALKAAFWSHIVYNYPPVKPLIEEEMPHAMGVWDLEGLEEVTEPSVDSKAILAWNQHRLVVVFRGTASMANALTNIKAWRAPHPPKRGWYLLCRQPLVHAGFLNAWRARGFNERIMARIRSLLDNGEVDATDCHVIVTGHSLGGAMATIAACDMQREFAFARLSCYTFGAPRTGNHSFARYLMRMVPDTWQVINDQDIVPRSAKLLVLYKMPGHRVIVNMKGDLVVRPSILEASLRRLWGGGKLADHMYKAYQRSLVAILAGQWGDKHQPGGRQGVQEMMSNPHVLYLMQQVGFGRLVLQAVALGHVQPLRNSRKAQALQEQVIQPSQDQSLKGAVASGVLTAAGMLSPELPAVLVDQQNQAAAKRHDHGAVSAEEDRTSTAGD